MGGEESEKLYNHFLQQMKSSYKPELIKGTELFFVKIYDFETTIFLACWSFIILQFK